MSPLDHEDESPSLSEIIDQQLISKASFIEPTRDLLPLAIDTVGRFAAVYWFGIRRSALLHDGLDPGFPSQARDQ